MMMPSHGWLLVIGRTLFGVCAAMAIYLFKRPASPELADLHAQLYESQHETHCLTQELAFRDRVDQQSLLGRRIQIATRQAAIASSLQHTAQLCREVRCFLSARQENTDASREGQL
jgi:hypothetical protein